MRRGPGSRPGRQRLPGMGEGHCLQHLEGRGEVFFTVLFSGGCKHFAGAGHHGHTLAEGFAHLNAQAHVLEGKIHSKHRMLEVFVEGAGSGVLELEGEGAGVGDLFDELLLGDVGKLGKLDAFGTDGVDAHAHEVLDELQSAAGLHIADVGGLAHLLEQAFLILVVGGLVAAAEQGAGAVRGKGGALAHGDDEVLLAPLGGFGFEHHHRFDVQGGQVEMHAAFGEVFKHAVGPEQNALGVFGHGHTGDAHFNLGSQFLLDGIGEDCEISTEPREQVQALRRRTFRPEFLNRLDDIVYYKSLTKDEIGGIVDLMLADLRSRLADKQLKLVVTDAAKSVIVDDGYDPIYGARPLKRYIQANVETMIAKEIIGGNHVPGDTLTVDAENGKLVLR